MANSTFTARLTGSYVDPFSAAVQLSAQQVAVQYVGQSESAIDIPAATPDNTTFSVPFGSVAKATGLLIKNLCAQSISVALNGSSDLVELPAGAMLLFASATAADTDALTSATIGLYDAMAADGRVGCFVFGDPV